MIAVQFVLASLMVAFLAFIVVPRVFLDSLPWRLGKYVEDLEAMIADGRVPDHPFVHYDVQIAKHLMIYPERASLRSFADAVRRDVTDPEAERFKELIDRMELDCRRECTADQWQYVEQMDRRLGKLIVKQTLRVTILWLPLLVITPFATRGAAGVEPREVEANVALGLAPELVAA